MKFMAATMVNVYANSKTPLKNIIKAKMHIAPQAMAEITRSVSKEVIWRFQRGMALRNGYVVSGIVL